MELYGKGNSISHYLSPLLSTPIKYEPWMWVLQQCFQSYVRFLTLDKDRALSIWNQAIIRGPKKHPVGPTSVFLGHLRRLGWTFAEHFRCITQHGDAFCLDQITTWQLKHHQVATSLPACLVPKLRSKIGVNDLQGFSIAAWKWNNQDAKLDGFVSTSQCGGLFTNRVKAKIAQGTAPACNLCRAQDWMKHRLYHCAGTQDLRHGQDWDTLKGLPRASLSWGLFKEPDILTAFWSELDKLLPPSFQQLPPDHELVGTYTCRWFLQCPLVAAMFTGKEADGVSQ